MQFIVRPNINIRTALLGASLALLTGSGVALAQSGSSGGSIGNDDKSVSGSRPPPSEDHARSARRSHEAEQPRRSSRRSGGGGGGGNFDGTWAYVGVGTNCQGSGSGTLIISGGRVEAPGTSGSVSSSGAYHASGVGTDGLAYNVNGRMSGNTGSGSFSRSDGCVGHWTASR
jgi:hypothetical protein